MPQAILTAPPTSWRWQALPFLGLMIELYLGFENWDLELLE
jgi:hypothetical protein